MNNNVFTLKDANSVFQKLATDERLPHALIGRCEERREAMIGIMLDELHVPIENIGRVLVISEPHNGFIVPRPDAVIGKKRYEDKSWVERSISINNKREKGIPLSEEDEKTLKENTIDWSFHTAVTLKSYNPFLEQDVEMVIDPHMNPTRMLNMSEFTSYLKRHTLGEATVDVSSVLEPNVMLLRKYGQTVLHWNSDPETVKDEKSQLLTSLARTTETLRQQGLLGSDYIQKWQELNEWSTGPAI